MNARKMKFIKNPILKLYKIKCSIKIGEKTDAGYMYDKKALTEAINMFNTIAKSRRVNGAECGIEQSRMAYTHSASNIEIVGNDLYVDVKFNSSKKGSDLENRFIKNGGIGVLVFRSFHDSVLIMEKTKYINEINKLTRVDVAINPSCI